MKATCKTSIRVRWVDVSKQDGENPKYRLRFVAQEAKPSPMPEFYVATPPLECLRLVLPSVIDDDAVIIMKKSS